jgi:hypothetical protein
MGTSRDTATVRRLRRQIGYYAGLALRTASRERIRLALAAIASRERRLKELARIPAGLEEER